jgi:hypothetical protein
MLGSFGYWIGAAAGFVAFSWEMQSKARRSNAASSISSIAVSEWRTGFGIAERVLVQTSVAIFRRPQYILLSAAESVLKRD